MLQRQARDAYAQDLDAAVEEADRASAEAAGSLRAAGHEADPTVCRGDAAAEIIAFAEERQAELIVVGSRGRSAIVEIVLGSVARNVMAGSKASVLVVRGTGTDRSAG